MPSLNWRSPGLAEDLGLGTDRIEETVRATTGHHYRQIPRKDLRGDGGFQPGPGQTDLSLDEGRGGRNDT